jgi:tetratricopeptide (TPR) repeat protein
VATLDPDRLAALEEERRFLLRSLGDLEREHRAGDIDEVDYQELRDGYTVRAAATLRAIEEGKAALPARPAVDWRRRAIVALSMAAMTGVLWWALAAWSAQRLPGQSPTGFDPRGEASVLLAEARMQMGQQPASAADLYGQVLELEPDNVEALTYRGWSLRLASMSAASSEERLDMLITAIGSLDQATKLDPTFPDSFCFLGIIEARDLDLPAEAVADLETCLAGNPPSMVSGMVEGLLDEMRAAVADE